MGIKKQKPFDRRTESNFKRALSNNKYFSNVLSNLNKYDLTLLKLLVSELKNSSSTFPIFD